MGKASDKMKLYKKIERYSWWSLLYLVIIGIFTVLAFIKESELSILFLFIFMITAALGIVLFIISKKNLKREIINFGIHYGMAQKEVLRNFELPYILVDKVGKIYWYNLAFSELLESKKLLNKRIDSFFHEINISEMDSIEEKKSLELKHNKKVYKVIINDIFGKDNEDSDFEKGDFYVLYFFDVTKEHELEIENSEKKGVVALLYIDNYDEVMHSIEDVRMPLLIALIDRNISKFIKKNDGVLKKFEKDKYIVFFQNKNLETMTEDKFSLLDEIREIDIGNGISVTLSIGIGVDEESFAKEMDYARIAIDLALGRGGDQAVVKRGDKLSFYGGKTKGVEKTTRVKARVKAHAFRDLIEQCDRVLVMGHKVQDMDSLGAAIGVYACAKHLNKPAHVIISNVTTSVNALYEQIMADDEYKEDTFITGQEAYSYINSKTLLVVVDVNRPSYVEHIDLLQAVNDIIVFDHHRVSADSIEDVVLSYIEPYASSACEMVTEILRYIADNVKLTPTEADALFAGISVDTKNFTIKCGVKTFEAAAFLRRNGADVVRVRKLFKNDMSSYKAKATAVRDATIYRDTIAITVCPSDVPNPNLVGAQAADELLNISGIKVSFVLTKVDDTIFISARSFDDMNVQLIMEKLGGGGHLSVAGAQLKDYSIEGAIEILKETIDDYIEKGENK
jgi:c-di-AMP phosphodiesterase-like protein